MSDERPNFRIEPMPQLQPRRGSEELLRELTDPVAFNAHYLGVWPVMVDEAATMNIPTEAELEKQAVEAAPHPVTSLDDRTIAHFHKLGYTHLSSEMIKDINYLEQLASTTGTSIEDWKPIELLTPLERGNKRAINKLFFAKVEDRKQVIGELDKETFERIQRSLFESTEARKQKAVATAMSTYNSTMHTIRERSARLNELIKQASITYEEMRRIEGITPDSTVEEFQKILKNPFYRFEKFVINKAYFTTASDVILRYRNNSRGEDWVMDFGKVRVVLDLHNNKVSASRFERNVDIGGGYYHPFISSSGEICFGSMRDTVYAKLTQHRYSEVFDIFAALLTTYDGGSNPYISLGEFIAAEKNGTLKRDGIAVTCKKCNVEESACECKETYYCECCDDDTDHETTNCDNYCSNCESTDNTSCGCNYEGDTF